MKMYLEVFWWWLINSPEYKDLSYYLLIGVQFKYAYERVKRDYGG